MTAQNKYAPTGPAMSGETPASSADDTPRLTIPVRFGRRRTDQVGHLVFTGRSLLFHGTVDIRLSWSEVSHLDHTGHDLSVTLRGSQRTMQFTCQAEEDALHASVTGSHLAALAAADPYPDAGV